MSSWNRSQSWLATRLSEIISALAEEHRTKTRRQLAKLEKNGITTYDEIFERFDGLNVERRRDAVWLLGRLRRRRAVPFLLRVLRDDRRDFVRAQAGIALSELGGPRALRRLEAILEEVADPVTRSWATYALAFLGEPGGLPLLESLYRDRSEPAQLRGFAAEGIGNLLGGADRRSRAWRGGVDTLLAGLDDRSAEVRYWTVFALGQTGARAALPRLRRMKASDRGRVEGRSIAKEAAEAIETIESASRRKT